MEQEGNCLKSILEIINSTKSKEVKSEEAKSEEAKYSETKYNDAKNDEAKSEAEWMGLAEKSEKLVVLFKDMESVVVAFSGGLDSTFLLKVAHDVLGDGVFAITARSTTYPQREFDATVDFTRKLGIRHVVIVSEELDIDGFSANPANRCYYCKKELFGKLWEEARRLGAGFVADGSNVDDISDYRPGAQAQRELGVVSPLREAGFTKADIRRASKAMGLTTWDKPAFACLASRIPYGQEITAEKLGMVDRAEEYLMEAGFRQVRVRHHGDIARIEVSAEERKKLLEGTLMDDIHTKLKDIGFKYITMDLKGYRTGSMNEVLLSLQSKT